jgi:hypothetical protein
MKFTNGRTYKQGYPQKLGRWRLAAIFLARNLENSQNLMPLFLVTFEVQHNWRHYAWDE